MDRILNCPSNGSPHEWDSRKTEVWPAEENYEEGNIVLMTYVRCAICGLEATSSARFTDEDIEGVSA